jgi:hypothetical protein
MVLPLEHHSMKKYRVTYPVMTLEVEAENEAEAEERCQEEFAFGNLPAPEPTIEDLGEVEA